MGRTKSHRIQPSNFKGLTSMLQWEADRQDRILTRYEQEHQDHKKCMGELKALDQVKNTLKKYW
jgi:hypothetical protein